MPDFTVQVRTSYKDVAGLVLSCTRAGIVEDPRNPGYVLSWTNEAPGLPSQPFIRQPPAATTYSGGRFSDPRNTDFATQPELALTGGGDLRVLFDRSRSTYLATAAAGAAFPSATSYFGIGYQFEQGADTSNDQTIMSVGTGSPGELEVYRRNGSGNADIQHGGSATTVAGDHPSGTFLYTGEDGGTSTWTEDGAAFGTGSATADQLPTASVLRLGCDPAVANFLDGYLDSFHVWCEELSPLTQDFIWQTLNEDGTAYNSDTRATMSTPVWTDTTADSAVAAEYDRLRAQVGAPFRFALASLPASPSLHIIQIAASINGVIQPDPSASPGDELFEVDVIEAPVIPAVTRESGWSSVIEVQLKSEGHYCFAVIRRSTGGVVYLHFDVEVG